MPAPFRRFDRWVSQAQSNLHTAVTVLLPLLTNITDFTWALAPVGVGAVIVVAIGIFYNNLFTGRRYPIFWW